MPAISDRLNLIGDVFPEILKPERASDLIRLKGILQTSRIDAIGLSWWEDDGTRVDQILDRRAGYTQEMLNISMTIDRREMMLLEAPEAAIWVISNNHEWNRTFCINYTFFTWFVSYR